MQIKRQKLWKNVRALAYIKKKLYLCARFVLKGTFIAMDLLKILV